MRRIATLTFWIAAALLAGGTARACTIFVLTGTNHTLFCNNEDWSNPATRIWFVPGGSNYYGCVYVGFDNGWAQGGLNTEGLACDWVAGFDDHYDPDATLRTVRGNPTQRMLETCASVEDAIAFYQQYREPGFPRARILVADKTGASVIVGGVGGKLQVEKANQCRGFGYGRRTLDEMLAKSPEPTAASGAKILRACRQKGQYATKYSNIFDLKSGDILIYPADANDVKFNLTAELRKGPHYYDIPEIREQLTEPTKPLLSNMQRFPLDAWKPIADKEPGITAHVRTMIEDAAAGSMRAEHYTPKLWQEVSAEAKTIESDLKRLGHLDAVSLVERTTQDGKRSYRYRLEFSQSTVLQQFLFNEENKLTFSQSECFEAKPVGEMPPMRNKLRG